MNCFDQYLSLIKVDKQFIKSNNYVATMMQDGDCFTEHSDYDGEDTDSFTLIVYLNDDYMGGELVFKDGPTLKPTAGSLIIFPSNLYHSVNIVNGDRYTIMVNMDKNDTLN
jgi:predicted 2-oxoglutarate/Fe(II)-dependent dioxygenase YbiX